MALLNQPESTLTDVELRLRVEASLVASSPQQEEESPILSSILWLAMNHCWVASTYETRGGGRQEPGEW